MYAALLDPVAVQRWMVPDGMTSEVHTFDAREGGEFSISLTYDEPGSAGKTSGATDSFHGRFVRLVPGTEVVQAVAFDTDDPTVAGEMTITYRLEAAGDGIRRHGHPRGPAARGVAGGQRARLAHVPSPSSPRSSRLPTRPDDGTVRLDGRLDAIRREHLAQRARPPRPPRTPSTTSPMRVPASCAP